MSGQGDGNIDTVMVEQRRFPPSAEFCSQASIKNFDEYQQLYDRAAADPEAFWAAEAKQHLHWFEPFTQALEWNCPDVKWFVGGKTNASYNCLDKHIAAGQGDRTAIIWEGEPGETRTLSYLSLIHI